MSILAVVQTVLIILALKVAKATPTETFVGFLSKLTGQLTGRPEELHR